MRYFVEKNSIVRQIWGKGDTVLFIFAGASAEFALNRAVDWLYFTGRLPAEPLGRLFSTVSYARNIVFSEEKDVYRAIDSIAAIHAAVETERGRKIPDWAYRDVLFMLIAYSIRSFEILERKLTLAEKEEVYDVFRRVGERMKIPELPKGFKDFQKLREKHMERDLQYSKFTDDLYLQYRKHLGVFRYTLLLESQKLICPQKVKKMMGFKRRSFLAPIMRAYKPGRYLKVGIFLRSLILPNDYKKEIAELDRV